MKENVLKEHFCLIITEETKIHVLYKPKPKSNFSKRKEKKKKLKSKFWIDKARQSRPNVELGKRWHAENSLQTVNLLLKYITVQSHVGRKEKT